MQLTYTVKYYELCLGDRRILAFCGRLFYDENKFLLRFIEGKDASCVFFAEVLPAEMFHKKSIQSLINIFERGLIVMRGYTADLSPGQIVGGRYMIVCAVGRGGSGTVYRVRDLRLKKIWALKLIGHSESRCQSGALELERMKRLNHPALPRIADTFEIDKGSCIVMDFLEGETLDLFLEEKADEHPRVGERQLLQWGVQLCDVLDYLHHLRPPVIYRDLKPGNILLRPDGSVMLLDFGALSGMGTPGYASPEQMKKGGFADERSDIYSLGRTLCRLYQSDKISKNGIGRNRRLLHVLAKACAGNPKKRFGSASEMKKALEHIRMKTDGYPVHRTGRTVALSFAACLMLLFPALILVISGGNAASASVSGVLVRQEEEVEKESQGEEAFAKEESESKDENSNERKELCEKAEKYREQAESCDETDPRQAVFFLEEACRCLDGITGKEDQMYDCRLRILRLLTNADPAAVGDPDTEISECFQKLCLLDPERREAYLVYISYEYRSGRLAEAADLFRKASEIEGIEEDPGYQSLKIKLTNAGAIPESNAG